MLYITYYTIKKHVRKTGSVMNERKTPFFEVDQRPEVVAYKSCYDPYARSYIS